jgi:hypothetical protein
MEFKQQEETTTENQEIYSYEDIYEMLCGTEYYSLNQLKYVYYNRNSHIEGYKELAQEYLKLCLEDSEKLKKAYANFKKPEEIKNEENKNIE